MAKFIQAIINQEGQAVPGASVAFQSVATGLIVTTAIADADGMVNITLPRGTYNLTISGDDINTKTVNGVELIDLNAGPSVPVTIVADAGKVLTAGVTDNTAAWSAIPKEVPDNAVGDSGKVLSAGATANSRAWTALSIGIPQFSPTVFYAQDDLVRYGDAIYKARRAATGAWVAADWAQVTHTRNNLESIIGLTEFSSLEAYAADDLVAYQGAIYRARGAVVAGTWNPTHWEEIGIQAPFATTAEVMAGTVADHPIAPDALRAASLVTPTATPTDDANYLVRLDATGKIADGFINFKTTTYRGNIDLTVAYTAPPIAWVAGNFGIASRSGNIHASWQPYIADPDPVSVVAGDVVISDGASYHVIASTAELTDYVKKAGDAMTGQLTLPAQVGAGAATPAAREAISRGYAESRFQATIESFTVAGLPMGRPVGSLALATDAIGRTLAGNLVGGGTIPLLAVFDGVTWVQA